MFLTDLGCQVFLNLDGERLVLLRDGWQVWMILDWKCWNKSWSLSAFPWEVVDLAQCGLAPTERFSFYDHVHTTGMDIKQPAGAKAMLTMNKDTSLRDYAQGAFRMRQLGKGQRVTLLITPEACLFSAWVGAQVEDVEQFLSMWEAFCRAHWSFTERTLFDQIYKSGFVKEDILYPKSFGRLHLPGERTGGAMPKRMSSCQPLWKERGDLGQLLGRWTFLTFLEGWECSRLGVALEWFWKWKKVWKNNIQKLCPVQRHL